MIQALNFNKIFQLASLAPSGDNLQPWMFKVEGDNKFSIFFDHQLAEHAFNPENTTSSVNLGMLLFLVEEEAARQGFKLSYTSDEKGLSDSNVAVITCSFEKMDNVKPFFSKETIQKRRVGRGNYLKQALPMKEMQSLLDSFNSKNENASFYLNDKFSKDTVNAMKKMERNFWNKKEYLKDIFKWVYFSKKEHLATRRGFHWTELGIKVIDIPYVFTVKKFTAFGVTLFNIIAHIIVLSKLTKSLDNSGFVMVSLKKRPSLSEWLAIGKDVMHLWCKVADLGLVSQPLSAQSFFISFNKWGIYKNEWPNELVSPMEKNLNKDFKTAGNDYPFWLFRFGHADARDTAKSLRIEVENLVKVEDQVKKAS